MFTDNFYVPADRRSIGAQYALRIFLGSVIAWFGLHSFGHRDPLWAVISVVMVSEPQLQSALVAFRWRMTNTLLGCGVGIAFLWAVGPSIWSLLFALVACILISVWIFNAPTGWRIGPISSLIVMTPGVLQQNREIGLDQALMRTVAVLTGSVIAVLIAWLLDYVIPKLKPSR